MAYVAPITWTTGQTVTAAEMNQNVRDNVAAVYSLAAAPLNNIGAGTITSAFLETAVLASMRNLVYMQLFPATEVITTTTGKAFFFVPAQFYGLLIKQIGIGIVTAGNGNTTVALGALTSINGNAFTEWSVNNVQLPATGTKISIDVTAGIGSPKGLDFWFVVG